MAGVKIDEINANIIRALLADARTSFTEMAKENNITVVAVRSRYENLKKAGVINGSVMQINPYYLGFNCTGFLGLSVLPEKTAEITCFLSKEPYILAIWNKIQETNIGAFFTMPNLENFTETIDKLKSYPHIKSVDPLIYVGFLVGDHPENLAIKPEIDGCRQVFEEKKPLKIVPESPPEKPLRKDFFQTPELQQMSNVDRQIAKMLSHNARTPFSVIAKKLNLSTSHVIKKYQKLRKKGLFIRSSISLDLQKLGYQANAMIFITIEPGTSFVDLQKQLLKIPNLITLMKTIGKCDLLAVVPLMTFTELFELETMFLTVKGIKKAHININPPFRQWPFNYFADLL